jgi:protein-disulfide isomerase
MASRTKQKEEARTRRLAEERAAAERAQRARRTRMLGGVLALAIVIVAVAIAVSASGGGGAKPAPTPGSAASKTAVTAVSNLLAGIPQSGETLGSPTAKVTLTEYADLECPVCDAFALPTSASTSDGSSGTGWFDQLVNHYVRTGKVKIVYRSLETASGNGPNASLWPQQQAAAYSAGLQGKAWDYIELFYYEQQSETSAYVTPSFLRGIAAQVPGLNLSSWASNLNSPTLQGQVHSDGQTAAAHGYTYTPTFVVQGPKGQAPAIQSLPSSYSQLTSEIAAVS